MNSKNKDRLVDEEVIRGLAELLNETGLSEIEIEQQGMRLRIARHLTVTAAVSAPASYAGAPAAAPHLASAAPAHDENHPGTVKSPMVGTVYRSPEPGTASFVEVGSQVKLGQTVLIIEAMKTMNHIPAPRAGTVKAIMVANEQPVEYGEALMIIE
jgi:acetyl-CoA carboxylase biotin carboxyl carrier protein